MSDEKFICWDILCFLYLFGIVFGCGVFVMVVIFVLMGVFMVCVNMVIVNGIYDGFILFVLGFVVGGGVFIVMLLIFVMLMFVVDFVDVIKMIDCFVLFDVEDDVDEFDFDVLGCFCFLE